MIVSQNKSALVLLIIGITDIGHRNKDMVKYYKHLLAQVVEICETCEKYI